MTTKCNTCGRPHSDPYRGYWKGQIDVGCVDKSHTEAMRAQRGTPSAEWHFRPVAEQIRRGLWEMVNK